MSLLKNVKFLYLWWDCIISRLLFFFISDFPIVSRHFLIYLCLQALLTQLMYRFDVKLSTRNNCHDGIGGKISLENERGKWIRAREIVWQKIEKEGNSITYWERREEVSKEGIVVLDSLDIDGSCLEYQIENEGL